MPEAKNASLSYLFLKGLKKMIAELLLIASMEPVQRTGSWEIGDGERIIRFDDEKSPSEFI